MLFLSPPGNKSHITSYVSASEEEMEGCGTIYIRDARSILVLSHALVRAGHRGGL